MSEAATGPYVLDQAGLVLDGEFNGFFPSGDGVPGSTFVQDLGVQTLQPPTVAAVELDPSTDSGIPGDANTNDTSRSSTARCRPTSPARWRA